MKKQMSALELGYMVKELQSLLGGKVVKVFQPDKEKIQVQLHIANEGKRFLNIFLPGFVFTSDRKMEAPETPSGFCTFLRKHIENGRITEIRQKGFERVMEIELSCHEKKRYLIVELIIPGNVILCDENYVIIGLLKSQKMKDRELLGGVAYKMPPKRVDVDDIHDVTRAINASQEDNLEKMLAVDMGLGGLFAQEVCKECGFNPKEKIPEYGIIKVFEAIKEIRSRKAEPRVIYDNVIIDAIPIMFSIYEKFNSHKEESFSKAIEKLAGFALRQKTVSEDEGSYAKQMKKMQRLLENQKEQLHAVEEEARINTGKADALYKNYQEVSAVLQEINSLREKIKWDEIKERLKGHAIVREIDAKEKRVVVEV